MTFSLKLSREGIKTAVKGIVYVLEFELEGKKLGKVGFTSRPKVEDRVCEILVSIWKRYRVFPSCYVKKYRTFDDPLAIERSLHKLLVDYKHTTKFVFSGSTEFFDVPLEEVVKLYDEITD